MRTIYGCLAFVLAGCQSSEVTADAGPAVDAGIDAGSMDAGSGVCTFGMDQTCNDDPRISALWGVCQSDGTCSCHAGFSPSATTGRCQQDQTYACGDTTCPISQFCMERVHTRDGGPMSTWMCSTYFQCTTEDCSCALMSFVSQSCVQPTCEHDAPTVIIRCDDLN